eukprot:TRINITY_DN14601_c0_g1_i1.p1 TRINITY_DN14601_c0_g1~~TRINITY_DN14601_c0_g1_i1.p1  ORF type:complete len:836 (+),score=120.16 TRINITY_DN14601_c0_g1_i1:100-2607(+)
MASVPWAAQASLDQSHCWVDGYTFEICCVPWGGAGDTAGQAGCWESGYSYEYCCPFVAGRPPRDFFTCGDRGHSWQRFRRNMILGRTFSDSNVSGMIKLDARECLLGAFVAALARLFLTMTIDPASSAADADFMHADYLFQTILRSPLSFDEILASGWPLGMLLATLRTVPAIQDKALRFVDEPPELTVEQYRLAARITAAIGEGRRVPLDAGLSSLLQGRQPRLEDSHMAQTAAFAASIAWSASYTLRAFDAPRAPPQEQADMLAEASRLLRLGEDTLRPAFMQKSARDGTVRALSQALTMQGPLLDLMQALQLPAVIEVDSLDLTRNSVNFVGLPPALRPPEANVLRPGVPPPLLQLHILPRYDSVSNLVRAARLPFCYETAYTFMIAAIVRAASCKDVNTSRVGSFAGSAADLVAMEEPAAAAGVAVAVGAVSGIDAADAETNVGVTADVGGAFCRQLSAVSTAGGGLRGGSGRYDQERFLLWEVGANLGDCTLWGLDMLSGRPTGSSPVAAKLEAVAVEPLPMSAAAIRRSGERLTSRIREEIVASRPDAPDARLIVHEAALSDRVGWRSIGVPRTSHAEATFQDCQHYYGTSTGGPGCEFRSVATDTVDHILLGGHGRRGSKGRDGIDAPSASCSEQSESASAAVVDLLKLHVQGSELSVLRGARRSLQRGRICVLILKLGPLGSFLESKDARDAETAKPVGNVLFDEIARETMSLLKGYAVSVVSLNGTSWERIGGGSVAGSLARYLRLAQRKDMFRGWSQYDKQGRRVPHPWDRQLVAWHEGPCCRESVAVATARVLWGRRFHGRSPAYTADANDKRGGDARSRLVRP